MASSVPAALDYLATQVRTLSVVTASVVVSDGWSSQRGDQVIVLGVTPEGDDAGITASYSALDSGTELEDVEVPSIIAVRMAGADSASRARARAFELFDAIRELVRADRRLGGAVRPGLPARISGWTMAQTSDSRQAGEGRVCEISWTLAWQHRG